MGIEAPVVSGAVKTSGFFLTPIGRINLIVTAIIFILLSFVGLSESFSEHSAYPFVERALLPIVGADTSVGIAVDTLNASPLPVYDGVLSKSFPVWLWFWLKFWFLVVCAIWFIYFFLWLLYWLWSLTDDGKILRNIVMALVCFILISLFVGMTMYNVRLSGLCLPSDRTANFNHLMANSYPLHGVSKLFVRFINKDFFYSVAVWSNSDFGKAVTNIPVSPNILNNSVNVTG